MEVWLLESVYNGQTFEELYIHLSDSDLWLTNISYVEEHIENVQFTQKFWKNEDNSNLLTFIGRL